MTLIHCHSVAVLCSVFCLCSVGCLLFQLYTAQRVTGQGAKTAVCEPTWGVARTMVDLSKGTAGTLSLSEFDGMELD